MSLYSTGIRPLVDEYLKKKSEEIRDYGPYFSASSAGYCHRYLIMKRLKVPPVPEREEDSARTTRVFEAGHIFHSWLQGITKEAGLSIAQELELQDEELMIRGHFDDLVLIDGKLILYDIKTCHSKAFDYKQEEIGWYHKYQLGTYMYMLRQKNWLVRRATKFDLEPKHAPANTKDLTEARILQIEKDSLRMREQQLLWSDNLEHDIVRYWQDMNMYWKRYQGTGQLPPCSCADPAKDGGWLGRRTRLGKIYNDYFFNGEPCSMEWFAKWEAEQNIKATK